MLEAEPRPVDDAVRDHCSRCGREIVTARLDGGRRVALDHPELGVEPDLDRPGRVVLLSYDGQARSVRAEAWMESGARHTRHDCTRSLNGGSV